MVVPRRVVRRDWPERWPVMIIHHFLSILGKLMDFDTIISIISGDRASGTTAPRTTPPVPARSPPAPRTACAVPTCIVAESEPPDRPGRLSCRKNETALRYPRRRRLASRRASRINGPLSMASPLLRGLRSDRRFRLRPPPCTIVETVEHLGGLRRSGGVRAMTAHLLPTAVGARPGPR